MFLVLKKAHGSNKAVTEKARYKILAIEGQAPDFIKTTRKHLGNLFDSGKTVIGNSTRGYPLQDNTFITCNESEFEDVFGDDFHMEAMNYDKLTMRLVGQNQVSKEYTITKVSKLSSSYKLKIEGKFEEDAAFVSTDDTYTNRIDDLSIDLIEHVVENKPEFDGRFFVKIYKDAVLEENVLNTSEDSLDYTVVASWGLRYLNNYGYTSGSYGANNEVKTEAKELLDSGLSSSNARHNHPTRYSHHAAYKWAGAASDSTTDLKGAQLPPTGNGLRAWDMREGSARALGDDTWTSGSGGSGFTPGAREFWIWMSGHEDFFIDAATAYSWTSMEENFDKLSGGGKDRPGNDYQTDVWSAGAVACGREFTLVVNTRGTKGSPSGQCSNTKYEKGQPSRGIWGGGSYMDLSWTGMGPGQEDTWTWPQPYAETLKEASIMSGGVRTAADSFMSTLVAPGTKFRFRRDPDEVVYTVEDFKDHPKGWHNTNIFKSGTSAYTGTWGIRNYKTWDPWQIREQHEGWNKRQRWTIKVTPQIGSGESGYNPIHGTISGSTTDVTPLNHDATDQDVIEIVRLTSDLTGKKDNFTDNPAIWETEPKESVDVDIYYQVGGLIPIMLDETTNEEYIPIGSHFFSKNTSGVATKHTVTEWPKSRRITFTPALPANTSIADGEDIMFYKRNNYNLGINHNGNGSALTSGTTMTLHGHNRGYQHAIWKEYHLLDWNNCWVFFNGAESDRARDDFNQKQMDNGVKASTVLAEPVREEHRKHGLIWSGIFNSNSGVNDTNQFIMAEKITKDLNPVYGSIQKLHTRNTDLITLCEDKILKILANKDALFNADGNTNVTATDKVLGAATPYKGKYGISTNPESFVATPFQLYFADPMRGQICALSGEGVRSISDLGMKDYFNDLLKNYVWQVLGTYDDKKLEYNVTIKKKYGKGQIVPTMTTVSYNEKTKGWVSFKSFTPQEGISLNNEYYTFHNGQFYKHHDNDTRNNFYGTQYTSDITLIFAQPSSSVKSFGSLRYEGSKQKITALTSVSHASSFTGNASSNDGLATVAYTDDEYFNLDAQAGWYVDNVTTNLQKSQNIEFKNKEGKYYGTMSGLESGSTLKLGTNWNLEEFSVQGLGTASISHNDTDYGDTGEWVIQNNVSATYGSPNWDTGADGND